MWPVTYSVTRCVLHDGNLPLAEAENGDVLTRAFVRGAGIAEGTGDVIAEIIGTYGGNAKAVYYLSNHRGDTLMAHRDSSTLVAKYRFDAFGNQRTAYCVVNEPENAPRYTFSTKEYLSDSKLYLYAYRVYDPVAGRWTQRDPIDYQDSINLYQFCGNNAVCQWDVDGRKMKEKDDPVSRAAYWAKVGAGVGAVAGAIVGGGGGAVLGLLTGPGAVIASPSGAAAGAAGGAVEGAILGAAAGAAASAMIDSMLKVADKLNPDAPNFEKMPQGNNQSKNKVFQDVMKELNISRDHPLWEKIHREITGQGLKTYKEIYNKAMEIMNT
jgi:RHS repeat-associated protein